MSRCHIQTPITLLHTHTSYAVTYTHRSRCHITIPVTLPHTHTSHTTAFLAILQLQIMKQTTVAIQTLYPPVTTHTVLLSLSLSLSLHFPVPPTQCVAKCHSVQ